MPPVVALALDPWNLFGKFEIEGRAPGDTTNSLVHTTCLSSLSFSYDTTIPLSILHKKFVSPEQNLGQFLTLLSCSFLGIEQVHSCTRSRFPNILTKSLVNSTLLSSLSFFMKTLPMQKKFVYLKTTVMR